jgi:hypothetical protein
MERMSTPELGAELLPPGSQIGPWRVVRCVGRGMFGTVYRVERGDSVAPRSFALKLREPAAGGAHQAAALGRALGPGEGLVVITLASWEWPLGRIPPFLHDQNSNHMINWPEILGTLQCKPVGI